MNLERRNNIYDVSLENATRSEQDILNCAELIGSLFMLVESVSISFCAVRNIYHDSWKLCEHDLPQTIELQGS